MKVLVVYDSTYGNTEKIAKSIASGFNHPDEVKVIRAGEANPEAIKNIQLLIVGSPTIGGRASQPIQQFLTAIPENSLSGIGVASFDTRFSAEYVGAGIRFVMKVFNFAAPRIAKALQGKGGRLLVPPEGFIVKGKEGPLAEGELERATNWAKGITREQKPVSTK